MRASFVLPVNAAHFKGETLNFNSPHQAKPSQHTQKFFVFLMLSSR